MHVHTMGCIKDHNPIRLWHGPSILVCTSVFPMYRLCLFQQDGWQCVRLATSCLIPAGPTQHWTLRRGERATSVYLTQKVIPMLPRRLCEELCSLNPGGCSNVVRQGS